MLGVNYVGRVEGYSLVAVLGTYGGAEIGSSDGSSYGNGDGKLDGSELGESLGAEVGTQVGSSGLISGGEVTGIIEVTVC